MGLIRSDEQEFYQLLSYKGDVDLEAKLDEWENFITSIDHMAHSTEKPLTKRSEKSYND